MVSREDILHYLGQQMITETSLLEPDTIDFAAGLGPMFLKLPREIRDIIFGRLLASGHTEFLRASKILSKEGTSLISKHGIYRTNIAFNSKANCPKLSQPVVDTVQNLHLRVNMRDYPFFGLGTFPEKRIVEMFGNRYLCRKSCSVSLEIRYSTESMIPLDVLNFLGTVGEFEDVTLSIETDWFGGSPFPDRLFEWQMRLMINS